jgi:uncharacterized SAM-binding protein YcdF (DUF218 family)
LYPFVHRSALHHWRQIIYWVDLVVVMFAVAWSIRPLMLRSLAQLWIVSDGLDHADAIVVLGGALDVRPKAAAELYKQGKAPRVAIGFSEYDQGRDARLTRATLFQHGVPTTAISEFRFAPHSTYGEARGILQWARASGINSVIIPTDIFPSRRVRWIFNHELAPAGIRVMVQAITPPWYNVDDWWRHKDGVIHFRRSAALLSFPDRAIAGSPAVD